MQIDQSENANLENHIVGSEIVQGGLIAGPVILEQLSRLMADSIWKLGSSAYELIKPANKRPLPPDENSILEELHEQGFPEITSITNYDGNWQVEIQQQNYDDLTQHHLLRKSTDLNSIVNNQDLKRQKKKFRNISKTTQIIILNTKNFKSYNNKNLVIIQENKNLVYLEKTWFIMADNV